MLVVITVVLIACLSFIRHVSITNYIYIIAQPKQRNKIQYTWNYYSGIINNYHLCIDVNQFCTALLPYLTNKTFYVKYLYQYGGFGNQVYTFLSSILLSLVTNRSYYCTQSQFILILRCIS